MAASPSPDPGLLAGDEGARLLDIADSTIVDGLRDRPPGSRAYVDLPTALLAPRGVFVTLEVDGTLNGCIGTIDAREPLAQGTARNAWAAAFGDPRLPPLRADDYRRLFIEVSVLSPLTPVPARDRDELVTLLRPHVDGVLLTGGGRRGVFLPKVWKHAPDPEDFLTQLEFKAGLAPGAWPAGTQAMRFTAQEFGRATS